MKCIKSSTNNNELYFVLGVSIMILSIINILYTSVMTVPYKLNGSKNVVVAKKL